MRESNEKQRKIKSAVATKPISAHFGHVPAGRLEVTKTIFSNSPLISGAAYILIRRFLPLI
ncbi:MAG: hypothetical protein PHI31_12005 [Desulfuromonadaceae bacterium]|nr:hypothetical protein [Desulfuromonadaceae bacterium]